MLRSPFGIILPSNNAIKTFVIKKTVPINNFRSPLPNWFRVLFSGGKHALDWWNTTQDTSNNVNFEMGTDTVTRFVEIAKK